jgi:DNA-binding phage protein
MTRKKLSKKRDFSFRDMPVTRLNVTTGIKSVKAQSRLRNIDLLFQSLWECLVQNDIESFKEILQAHLEATNKEALIRRTKISRRTLYRMLSPEGNPTLENVGKILQALAA